MPAPSVFISYAHEDQPLADALCRGLENAGHPCAIAPRDIPPGEAYGAWIVSSIRAAPVMVLVLSASSNRSSMVRRELERAASLEKRVIPIRIDQVEADDEVRFFLSREHWLDAPARPIDQYIAPLAAAVQRLLLESAAKQQAARTTASASVSTAAAPAQRQLSTPDPAAPAWLWRVASVVVVLGLVIGGVAWWNIRAAPSTGAPPTPPTNAPANPSGTTASTNGASTGAANNSNAAPSTTPGPSPAPAPAALNPPLHQIQIRPDGSAVGPVLNEVEHAAACAALKGANTAGVVVSADAVARLVRAALVEGGFDQVRVTARPGINKAPAMLRIEFKASATKTALAARAVASDFVIDPATFVTIVAD